MVLVDVEEGLVVVTDVDRAMWLVPSYIFTDEDGGPWQTLAIEDGFLEYERPPADADTLPIEPDPAAPPRERELPAPQPPPDEPDDHGPSADLEALVEDLVGLGEQEATERLEAEGASVRVVYRDGELFVVTDDFRPDRVNLHIEDGEVTDATIG
ncbi:hypothetical protein ER308_04355 [Egibacter rhizosphaerae]|uniref:Uncharacterized protein n=1 Tax=Egibacter rhizosphaerae TaxID=1670831 RepID=A0A411YCD3_9ACTN|nr:hypothetical protein [Egibacter rhizosphaerae]QBI18848.1 hypothetical protein ER308_04355 [Egibacter rhizosphaerae]